jgi:hypothetical protein
MITPEVNDVDVQKLFNWFTSAEVYIKGKPKKFYIRLAGDADLGKARVFALRKSNEFRLKLKDETSDEFLALIGPKELFDKDSLISVILLHKVKEISREAYKTIDVPFPKEPDSDADLEEQERYQKEVDEYEKKVKDLITKYIERRLEEIKLDLDKKSLDELYEIYKDEQTRSLCEGEMLKAFKQYCVHLNVFLDKNMTKRAFNSYDEFDNLPQEIKTQFLDIYDSLDLDVETLKK